MDEKKISSIKKTKKKWFGKDRKTKFGQTNLNNCYFMREIKKTTDDFLNVHGEQMKKDRPEIYYSMINKPLPKKYQKKEKPLTTPKPDDHKPPQVTLKIKDDLSEYQKQREMERKKKLDQLKQHSLRPIKFETHRKDPCRGMGWVDARSSINTGKLGHSQSWKFKREKKYDYYG